MNLFLSMTFQHTLQHAVIFLAGIIVARTLYRLDIRPVAVPCVLVFYPAYFFTQALAQSQTITNPTFTYLFFFYVFHTGCLYALAKGVFKLLGLPPGQQNLCVLFILLSSLLGLPLIQSTIVPAAESNKYVVMISFYESVLAAVFGVYLLHAHRGIAPGWKNVAASPLFYAILMGFVLVFFRLFPPFLITDSAAKISAAAVPLGVVMTGMAFGKYIYLMDKSSYIHFLPAVLFCLVFRLMISPLLAWGIAQLMNMEDIAITRAVILTAGMPTGILAAVLGVMYAKSEYHGMAALTVVLSTVCSMITIPLLIMLVNHFYPI